MGSSAGKPDGGGKTKRSGSGVKVQSENPRNSQNDENNRQKQSDSRAPSDKNPIISVPGQATARLEIDEKSANQLKRESEEEKRKRKTEKELEDRNRFEEEHISKTKLQSLKKQLSDGVVQLQSKYPVNILKMTTIISCIKKINAVHTDNRSYYEFPEDKHEKYALHREKGRLLHRLSELAGARLKHNNPDIADLSDPNRATKLAEKISELYDNEWTDTFENTRAKVDGRKSNSDKESDGDKEVTGCLRDVLKFCYKKCEDLATMQRQELCRSLNMSSQAVLEDCPPFLRLRIKEFQKKACPSTIVHVQKIIKKEIKETIDNEQLPIKGNLVLLKELKVKLSQSPVLQYVERCVEVSWFTQIQDPPVVMDFDNNGPSMYKPYTKSGPQLDYVVWPVLLLHEGGPMLAKGVAQFMKGPCKQTPDSITTHL